MYFCVLSSRSASQGNQVPAWARPFGTRQPQGASVLGDACEGVSFLEAHAARRNHRQLVSLVGRPHPRSEQRRQSGRCRLAGEAKSQHTCEWSPLPRAPQVTVSSRDVASTLQTVNGAPGPPAFPQGKPHSAPWRPRPAGSIGVGPDMPRLLSGQSEHAAHE